MSSILINFNVSQTYVAGASTFVILPSDIATITTQVSNAGQVMAKPFNDPTLKVGILGKSGQAPNTGRTFTTSSKIDVTDYKTFEFNINKGGIDQGWGDIPDSTEDFILEYSLDGVTYVEVGRASALVLDDNITSRTSNVWYSRVLEVPSGAKVSEGVFLRYTMYQNPGSSTQNDNWAVTNLLGNPEIGAIGFGGSRGFDGSTGYTGSVGYTGSQGVGFTGSRGDTGFIGSRGTDGTNGYTGSIGAGYQGSKGDVGGPARKQLLLGDGTTTTFTMTESTPLPENIFVIVNGLVQIPTTDYTVNGTNLIFANAPNNTADIEIRYFDITIGVTGFRGSLGFQGSVGYTGSLGLTGGIGYTGSRGYGGSIGSVGYVGSTGAVGAPSASQLITGDGITSLFDLDLYVQDTKHIFVTVNGLLQIPDTDYTITNAGLKIQFSINSIPGPTSDVEIRFFTIANVVGFMGSSGFQGSVGNSGVAGFKGSLGDIGFKGSLGDPGGSTGYTGSRGAIGSTGFSGSRGFDGAAGVPSVSQTFVGDGTTTIFTMTQAVSLPTHIIVSVNGLVQIPTTDYTVSGNQLTFVNAPGNTSDIEIRYFEAAGQTGYQGSAGVGGTGYQGSIGSVGFKGSVGFGGSSGLNGIANVFVSSTADPNPFNGELWFDIDNGILSIYYESENIWVGLADGPRGDQGYTGSGGPGYTGSIGVGFTGSQGIPGIAAEKGYTGSIGYTGSPGGPTGYTGSAGAGADLSLVGNTNILYNNSGVINGSNSHYINTTNRFGFGVSSPQHFFHVGGNAFFTNSVTLGTILIANSSSGTAGQVLTSGGSTSNAYWSTSTGGDGGALKARNNAAATISLASEATGTTTITGYKGYALYAIQTTYPAWVRLYVNEATRTSDASRVEGQEPTYGSGVLAEVLTTTASETVYFTPAIIGYSINSAAPPNETIYVSVKNKDTTTRSITVTLTLLQLEL